MKKVLTLLFILLILPLASAINVSIEKTSSNEVMISDLNEPAIFDLEITNNAQTDNFYFYNLLGFSIEPQEKTSIASGSTKKVQLKIFPRGNFDYKGFYTFTYFLQGKDTTETSKELTFKIIDLKDAFKVGSGELNPETNMLEVYIQNQENFNFKEIETEFSSAFFNFKETFALAPNERKTFDVKLNKEDFKKLMAGFYTLETEIKTQDLKTKVNGIIKFTEKDILTTTKKDYGLIISTKIIEKKNQGNTLINSETLIKKNIISRLFTSFSPEPNIVERKGMTIYYTWNKEIKPGETLEIKVKTNWLFPFLIIFFVITIVVLTKQYSKTDLVLRKKIQFVKTKGGEFALKVTLIVNAKKYIERVNIIDKLPPLVKIYERFGVEKPSKIDEKNKRIDWDFKKLEAGEVRVLSYVIYSKISVLGKFALPSATAIYEKNGKVQESFSNRAFFMAEQIKGDVEDY